MFIKATLTGRKYPYLVTGQDIVQLSEQETHQHWRSWSKTPAPEATLMQAVTVPDQDILDAAVSQVFPDGILGMHTGSLGNVSVESSRPATPQPLKIAPQTATQTATQTAAAPSGLVDVSVQLQQLIEVLRLYIKHVQDDRQHWKQDGQTGPGPTPRLTGDILY